jgi:hypothetical protein
MPICKNPRCGKDHPSHIRCEQWARQNAATQATVEPDDRGVEAPLDTRPVVAAPVRKAKEFLRKVGRPKVYPDRKTQMRELMRRKRQK